MMKRKKFVLGVGAQKSGTSWLWSYLFRRSDVNTGFRKEYHLFDQMTLDINHFVNESVDQMQAALESGEDDKLPGKVVRRFNFYANPNSYFDYFSGLLREEGTLACCDITPTYAGLSVATLQMIKDEFEKRDIDVLPVFLIREPVLRLQSAAKMQLGSKKKKVSRKLLHKRMKSLMESKNLAIRGDYGSTIENLNSVFGERRFITLYETLFTDASIEALCRYLEIPFVAGNYDTKKKEGGKVRLDSDQLLEFRPFFESQYKAARMALGPELIDEHWQIR